MKEVLKSITTFTALGVYLTALTAVAVSVTTYALVSESIKSKLRF